MGSAFSSKKSQKPQPSEVDKAILSLKTQRRKLGEYQRQVQEKAVRAQENAQRFVQQKNKQKALFNLKQKKLFEVRLAEIDKFLINVEETLCNIDTARQNNKVFEALRTGTDALKSIQQKVSVAALEELMADTEQTKEHEREVNALLGEENVDLAEVEAEMRALEEEVLGEEAGAAVEEMPSVPTKPLPTSATPAKAQQQQQQQQPQTEERQEEPMLA